MRGRLFVVSTPIGNLGDLSSRAARVLADADRIACEDTRRTRALLTHLGLSRPLVSLHEHNERKRLPELLVALGEGETVALVSDAGTPLLCDPGFRLVRAAREAGAEVLAIPGPSALLAALVVSGFPPYPFTFAGFPPPRPGKRRAFYRELGKLAHTLVFFESPHRLLASLEDALAVLGNRRASLSRELTKLHEETLVGPLGDLLTDLREHPALRGEWTVVLAPPPTP